MDKLQMQSKNLVDENIEFIAKRFPNCVTEALDEEGKLTKLVDFDMLKQELSHVVIDGDKERYTMTWPDKKQAILIANAPIAKTLRPCRKESVDFDHTQNLYIEGDNLDVLKLLRETYLGKIKMIYIDPPYNTGNDFVYNDDFAVDTEEYLERSNQVDDQGNRMVANNDNNGRFHTDWLNMIYPRLKLAKDLLTDDGVIFISIDDNEQANLKKICDEIFGMRNFIAQFPRVTKRGGKSTDKFAKNNDYVIVYSKNYELTKIKGISHVDEGFKNKDEYYELRGPYKLNQTLDYNTLQYNTTMDYTIELNGKMYVPGGDLELHKERHNGKHGKHDWVWRWSKKLFDFGLQNGWIEISKSGRIYTKTYLNATISKDANENYYIEYVDRTRALTTLDFVENIYSNDNSNKELANLMGSSLFDYSKPTALIKMLTNCVVSSGDIVMDFFSGSGTTADAVFQYNAENNAKCSFICVQLPEICTEGTEAYKQGYKNICDIAKERIHRAGKKIKEENPNAKDLDIGFRDLKLDSSCMKDIYYSPNKTTQDLLTQFEDNIKEDRTPEDLLFQVMLDMGVMLSSEIKTLEINGKKVFNVNDGDLVCCFDKNINDEVVTAIAKMQPLYAVFRDASMSTDSVAVNFDQSFETYSPTTTRKII